MGNFYGLRLGHIFRLGILESKIGGPLAWVSVFCFSIVMVSSCMFLDIVVIVPSVAKSFS